MYITSELILNIWSLLEKSTTCLCKLYYSKAGSLMNIQSETTDLSEAHYHIMN